jgi:hypothetical protein
MEPHSMITGRAVGVVASLAVRPGVAVQDVSVAGLQKKLREGKAVLNPVDAEANPKAPKESRY